MTRSEAQKIVDREIVLHFAAKAQVADRGSSISAEARQVARTLTGWIPESENRQILKAKAKESTIYPEVSEYVRNVMGSREPARKSYGFGGSDRNRTGNLGALQESFKSSDDSTGDLNAVAQRLYDNQNPNRRGLFQATPNTRMDAFNGPARSTGVTAGQGPVAGRLGPQETYDEIGPEFDRGIVDYMTAAMRAGRARVRPDVTG